jgi:hypothetical protein
MSTDEATDPTTDGSNGPTATTGTARTTVTDSEREPVTVRRGPSRAAQLITVVAALLGMGLTTPFTLVSIPFGVAGLVIVALSMTVATSVRWLSVGTALILVGAVLAGAFGALSPEVALVGVSATVLAWDAGQHGIVLGEQLGRGTAPRRNLIVHVAATTVALTVVSAVGYATFVFVGGQRPAPAVSVVLLGIVFLAWLYRR